MYFRDGFTAGAGFGIRMTQDCILCEDDEAYGTLNASCFGLTVMCPMVELCGCAAVKGLGLSAAHSSELGDPPSRLLRFRVYGVLRNPLLSRLTVFDQVVIRNSPTVALHSTPRR